MAEAAGLVTARLRSAPLGCGFLLGGVDSRGACLLRVEPDGASTNSAYASMGSGQMAAVATLEASRLGPDASRSRAIDAVRRAVEAGVRGDTGSGGHVDVVVVDGAGTERLRFEARR